ncbi:hypothetical protein GH714_040040 [Hevea brasiliensis]|uniref:SAM dependent carboxyl methyltransferase n=1 Tax=Hevea brasiliensis TaxID=3981 RepID=A0A6A6MKV4_HEVBR|nr:hypothetical protein GH714_040040 [Hevea brasiliensis]
MDTFLNARARELVAGGLLTIILVGLPADGILFSQTATGVAYDLLSSCLVDLANKEKVEAFNLPLNYPSIKDMEALLGRSESFSIERLETISNHAKQKPTVQFAVSTIRAFIVEQIKEHFGGKIVYSVFECFTRKLTENFPFAKDQKNPQHIDLFILLKRNNSCNTV